MDWPLTAFGLTEFRAFFDHHAPILAAKNTGKCTTLPDPKNKDRKKKKSWRTLAEHHSPDLTNHNSSRQELHSTLCYFQCNLKLVIHGSKFDLYVAFSVQQEPVVRLASDEQSCWKNSIRSAHAAKMVQCWSVYSDSRGVPLSECKDTVGQKSAQFFVWPA